MQQRTSYGAGQTGFGVDTTNAAFETHPPALPCHRPHMVEHADALVVVRSVGKLAAQATAAAALDIS